MKLGVALPMAGAWATPENQIRVAQRAEAIWTEETVEFRGEFYRVPKSIVEPKPLQKPHPPITIGGYGPTVIRRAVTLGDGFNGGNVPLAQVAPLVAQIKDAAREVGRDPATLQVRSVKGSKMIPTHRRPTHPGQILQAEFLAPLGQTQVKLAERIGVPVQRINEIIRGKRGITPATAWLFAQAFGTTPQCWSISRPTMTWRMHDRAAAFPSFARPANRKRSLIRSLMPKKNKNGGAAAPLGFEGDADGARTGGAVIGRVGGGVT